MEFQGRIAKLLPLRQGVSQRTGNEWKALPFVFEYYENPSDRYADSVVLETFDENVINNLKEGMEVRCGFGHHTREYEGKVYNDIRLYKIESVKKAQQTGGGGLAAALPQHTEEQAAPAMSPQQQGGQDEDDLPF
ncbi:MAG: DUF3127 domain-containing protein [Bacteroidaceae bacterium]|nr:DUF3127 domain-containing protein [Bacteroidaceae bacterium]